MMSSGLGEPSLGGSLTMLVSSVELYPEQPLVRLWGTLEEKRADYQRLRSDMQALATTLPRGLGRGGLGSWYLLELGGQWHRCRLLSRPGAETLSVFLLDQGRTVGPVSPQSLVRCPEPFLRLAPQLLCCVLANLAPADGQRWSPAAAELLHSQRGQRLQGLVREILPQQRLLVIEVPSVSHKMQELELARVLPEQVFRQTCLPHLGYSCPAQEEPPVHRAIEPPPVAGLDYFYPLLQTGGAEPVLVTQAWDPQRVFCQLRSLSQEVQRLSDSMYHYYEARQQGQPAPGPWSPETLGQPCAARGADGRWHRALLRQLFADRDLAQVIHVDYGRRELVSRSCLRPLLAEYFRMPVVTYSCALFGVSDSSSGCWSLRQVNELRALLLGQPVSARIEYYSTYERVYFVTLYDEDGLNLNSLFSMQAHCPESAAVGESTLEVVQKEPTEPKLLAKPKKGAKSAEQRAILSKAGEVFNDRLPKALETAAGDVVKGKARSRSHNRDSHSVSPEEKVNKSRMVLISGFTTRRELKINTFYDAVIDSIRDPSEFWLRAGEQESLQYKHMMTCLTKYYSVLSKLEKIIVEIQPGMICCVKFNTAYYRATVLAVHGKIVEVYCLDTGATEEVDWYDVKELDPQFKNMPPYALKCCLADVVPREHNWSQEAIDYFKSNVVNKLLVIQVLAKEDDKYIIEVLDESREGVRNISKIIVHAGHAIYHEFVPPPPSKKVHAPVKDAINDSSKGKQLSKRKVNLENQICFEAAQKYSPTQPLKQSDNSIGPMSTVDDTIGTEKHGNRMNPSKHQVFIPSSDFQGLSFDIGSVLDVKVIHIESPGFFWCQITRTLTELKVLMNKIQDYCKNYATSYKWNKTACLAKYSEDGKWYRAFITSEVPLEGVPPEGVSFVDVEYVDYGNKESVSVNELRSIGREFLQLKSQAFKCSLYNRIQPIGNDPFFWSDEAIDTFQEFVNANPIELKCTIYALASLHNELFHIVDLTTPFCSVGQYLIENGFAKSNRFLEPSVRLHSYYYSTHGIKIGSEEAVFVTHVEKPSEFYCQLERSTDRIEQLSSTVNLLANSAKHVCISKHVKGLCLAKYADEQWYRGMLRETDYSQEVFFVDFGNKEKVLPKDLCPLPNDAYEILLPPVQAIKCGLSDIPISIEGQVAMWFETAVLGNAFKAVVVAKEMDGKLLVELYDGTVQINAQIKERLRSVYARDMKVSISNEQGHIKNREDENSSLYLNKVDERKVLPTEFKEQLTKRPTTYSTKTAESKTLKCEIKEDSLNKYIQWSQRAATDNSRPKSYNSKEREHCHKLDPTGGPKQISGSAPNAHKDLSIVPSSQGRNKGDSFVRLYKLCDLPQKDVLPGLKTEIYISHINDPSDFFIQFCKDDDQLGHISVKLNEGEQETSFLHESCLQAGDLICALFPEDGSWYRAVLEKKASDGLHVQYIDYGNTAVINACNTCKFLNVSLLPALSIHCSLSGFENFSNWTSEATGCFFQKASEQLYCEFVQLHVDKWKIRLFDAQDIIINDLINNLLKTNNSKGSGSETSQFNAVDLFNESVSSEKSSESSILIDKQLKWQPVDTHKTLQAYAVTVDGPGYFWCQRAEAEDLETLAGKLQEAGERLWQKAEVSIFQNGDPCIVKYSEDEQWYRAIIRGHSGHNLIVIFVDYGNQETVSRETVREIPEELLTFPVQAFPCRLWGFDVSEGFWAREAKEAFNEVAVLDKLDVTVIELRANEELCEVPLSLVKLEIKGKCLNDEMLRFWIQNQSYVCSPAEGMFIETNDPAVAFLPSFDLPSHVCVTEEIVEENNSCPQDAGPSSYSLIQGKCSSLHVPGAQLILNATVLPPQSLELPNDGCCTKREQSVHNIFPTSDTLEGPESTLCSPLPPFDEQSRENAHISDVLLKKNDSCIEFFDPGCGLLPEENCLLDVPRLGSLKEMETTLELPSGSCLLSKDVGGITQILQANVMDMLDTVPTAGVWQGEIDGNVLDSDSINGTKAKGFLPSPSFSLPIETSLHGQFHHNNSIPPQDAPNSVVWGKGNGGLEGTEIVLVHPPLSFKFSESTSATEEKTQVSICTVKDIVPRSDFFVLMDVVGTTAELPEGNNSLMQDSLTSPDLLQADQDVMHNVEHKHALHIADPTLLLQHLSPELPTDVRIFDLQQKPGGRAIEPQSDLSQEERCNAVDDALKTNISFLKPNLSITPESPFVEEFEARPFDVDTEQHHVDSYGNVFDEGPGESICEMDTVKLDFPLLVGVEKSFPATRETLEKEQSCHGELDINKGGHAQIKATVNPVGSCSQNQSYRAEMQLEHDLYEEIFRSRTSESLSSLRMPEEYAQIEHLQEDECTLGLDTGTIVLCPDHITTIFSEENQESKTSSSSEIDEEGMSVFCLYHQISFPEENVDSEACTSPDTDDQVSSLNEDLLAVLPDANTDSNIVSSANPDGEGKNVICSDHITSYSEENRNSTSSSSFETDVEAASAFCLDHQTSLLEENGENEACTSLDTDEEKRVTCSDHIISFLEENLESKAASSSETDEEAISVFCLDHQTSFAAENVENVACTLLEIDEGKTVICSDHITSYSEENREGKASSTSETDEEVSAFFLDHQTSLLEENLENEPCTSLETGEGIAVRLDHQIFPDENVGNKDCTQSDTVEEITISCSDHITDFLEENLESKAASSSEADEEGISVRLDHQIFPDENLGNKDCTQSDTVDEDNGTGFLEENLESKAASSSEADEEEICTDLLSSCLSQESSTSSSSDTDVEGISVCLDHQTSLVDENVGNRHCAQSDPVDEERTVICTDLMTTSLSQESSTSSSSDTDVEERTVICTDLMSTSLSRKTSTSSSSDTDGEGISVCLDHQIFLDENVGNQACAKSDPVDEGISVGLDHQISFLDENVGNEDCAKSKPVDEVSSTNSDGTMDCLT
ncbi:tudor domain-containing protein 6 isoform X2 [Ambystoma mexicanum]|uniref:tudor domain-containing protein 6 isoform X2 n=1 Tax=Ambystoma mexicanum TaxID=8296 RepID=UPI0037E92D43